MKKFFVLVALALSAVACKGECGDGVQDAPNKEDVTEGCDDGAAVAGDGCDAACAVEAGFECAGAPSVCALSCSDGSLDAGEQCDDANVTNADGCSSVCTVENGFECVGSPSVCTPLCGNGTPNAGEICDDGNTSFGDGCDGACFVEGGFECVGSPSVCTLSCGDDTVDAGEGCDDGDTTAGDGCNANCQVENGFECIGEPSVCTLSCGDATLDANEECDDADTINGDGCNDLCEVEIGFECVGAPSVCTPSCGDSTLDAGEGCDDGDTTAGDGCNAACAVEGGFICNGEPSVCIPLLNCPNGAIEVGDGEECDDDNANVGDGCDASCQTEQGFLCNGQPSVCNFVCGNGVLNAAAGEQCDDGNLIIGDGCNALCLNETPEDCDNGLDEDLDGFIDCADILSCGANALCAPNSCGFNETSGLEVDPTVPTQVALAIGGQSVQNDTTAGGVSSTIDGSCQLAAGGGDGLDITFELALASAGLLTANLVSPGNDNPNVDNGIMIHNVCNGNANQMPPNANELACGDVDFSGNGGVLGEDETAAASIQAAGTLFVTVGAFTSGSEGAFTLTLNFAALAATEIVNQTCLDGIDNDGDGNTDCADNNCAAQVECIEGQNCTDAIDNDVNGVFDCQQVACQNTADCIPGAIPVGGLCDAHTDCDALNGDPICISEVLFGFSDGYCAEGCSVNAECGATNFCLFGDQAVANSGLCFDGCLSNADCNAVPGRVAGDYFCITETLDALCDGQGCVCFDDPNN